MTEELPQAALDRVHAVLQREAQRIYAERLAAAVEPLNHKESHRMNYQQRFERLRTAVLAYDNALRAYGLMGQAWIDHSDELDQLWANVLDATEEAK